MPHMVIHRGVDGETGYHQVDDVADAIELVERLRNDEGVEHARIFRLEEVHFQFRPYYRVELDGPRELVATEEPETPGLGAGAHVADDAAPALAEAQSDGGARRGLFGR